MVHRFIPFVIHPNKRSSCMVRRTCRHFLSDDQIQLRMSCPRLGWLMACVLLKVSMVFWSMGCIWNLHEFFNLLLLKQPGLPLIFFLSQWKSVPGLMCKHCKMQNPFWCTYPGALSLRSWTASNFLTLVVFEVLMLWWSKWCMIGSAFSISIDACRELLSATATSFTNSFGYHQFSKLIFGRCPSSYKVLSILKSTVNTVTSQLTDCNFLGEH